MATKLKADETDCYARLAPDEPYFVLMARDPDFGIIVRIWAHFRNQQIAHGGRPDTTEERLQIVEAQSCASDGDIWGREYRARKELARYTFNDNGSIATKDGVPVEKDKIGS